VHHTGSGPDGTLLDVHAGARAETDMTGLLPVPAPAGSWLSTLTVRDFQLVDEMDRADVDLRARQFAGPGPTKPSLFASVGTSFAATRL